MTLNCSVAFLVLRQLSGRRYYCTQHCIDLIVDKIATLKFCRRFSYNAISVVRPIHIYYVNNGHIFTWNQCASFIKHQKETQLNVQSCSDQCFWNFVIRNINKIIQHAARGESRDGIMKNCRTTVTLVLTFSTQSSENLMSKLVSNTDIIICQICNTPITNFKISKIHIALFVKIQISHCFWTCRLYQGLIVYTYWWSRFHWLNTALCSAELYGFIECLNSHESQEYICKIIMSPYRANH